jgi:hypothetical protein
LDCNNLAVLGLDYSNCFVADSIVAVVLAVDNIVVVEQADMLVLVHNIDFVEELGICVALELVQRAGIVVELVGWERL